MEEPVEAALPENAEEAIEVDVYRRRQGFARKVAAGAWKYRCCVICGTTFELTLDVAHLDHRAGNNEPANLAWMCKTHHWMYDCGLYPRKIVEELREHWDKTRGEPDHKPRMKDAGPKAARTRQRSAAARKAVATRRARASGTISE